MPIDEKPKHTPIPTSEFNLLTRNVAEITIGVKSITEHILPPIAKDARKASDSVIKLTSWNKEIDNRISKIENGQIIHNCPYEEEINKHDTRLEDYGKAITAQEKDVAGLSRWRTYIASITIPLALVALSTAGKAIADAATAQAERDAQSEITTRHEKEIDALEAARERDRQIITQQIKAIPIAVKTAVEKSPTIVDLKVKLTPRSQKRLELLLDEADIEM